MKVVYHPAVQQDVLYSASSGQLCAVVPVKTEDLKVGDIVLLSCAKSKGSSICI